MGAPEDEDGEVQVGTVQVEARAVPATELEDLRKSDEVPLLGVECAGNDWSIYPARGWDVLFGQFSEFSEFEEFAEFAEFSVDRKLRKQ